MKQESRKYLANTIHLSREQGTGDRQLRTNRAGKSAKIFVEKTKELLKATPLYTNRNRETMTHPL